MNQRESEQIPFKERATRRDKNGRTALHAAVEWDNHPRGDVGFTGPGGLHPQSELLQALLDAGAQLNAQDKDGVTPLALAFRNDHVDAGKFFLEHGANPNLLDNTGWGALTWAAWFRQGPDENTAYLRKKGAVPTLWDALLLGETDLARPLAPAASGKAQTAWGLTLLHLAAQQGDRIVLRHLLAHGADPCAADSDKRTALHFAQGGRYELRPGQAMGYNRWVGIPAASSREDVVETLLQAGAKVGVRDGHGLTPLDWAFGFGREDLMRMLLKAGADPNQRDPEGVPLLLKAVQGEHTGLVQMLLEAGADPRARVGRESQESVLDAVRDADPPQEAMLIRMEEVSARLDQNDAALRTATSHNQWEAVRALLKAGANPNTRDATGRTALHATVAWSAAPIGDTLSRRGSASVDLLRVLLKAGAALNAQDQNGRTAVVLAFKNEHLAAGNFLVEQGADLRITDELGWSALTWHCSRFRNRSLGAVPDLLRKHKAPLSLWDALLLGEDALAARLVDPTLAQARAEEGTTLLHLAARRGNVAVTERLIAFRADVNASDGEERTPLHYAIGGYWYTSTSGQRYWETVGPQETRAKLVTLLLRSGAKVDAKDNFFRDENENHDGSTPLEWAVGFQRPDLMRLLLKAKANPNQTSEIGFALLFEAIHTQNPEVVKVLLDAGADPRAKGYGRSALEVAQGANGGPKNPQIIKLIEKALVTYGKKRPR